MIIACSVHTRTHVSVHTCDGIRNDHCKSSTHWNCSGCGEFAHRELVFKVSPAPYITNVDAMSTLLTVAMWPLRVWEEEGSVDRDSSQLLLYGSRTLPSVDRVKAASCPEITINSILTGGGLGLGQEVA